MKAERITEALAAHGEGPIWDARLRRLMWVDMLRGDVLSLDPESGTVERQHVAEVAACVAPRVGGGHVVATERGFVLLHPERAPEPIRDVWTDPTVRMNDGGCDPQGRFYCGSMAYDAAPGRGSLYRLDIDRTVHRVLGAVTISNGLAWSADGRTAYYIDSETQRIDAYTFVAEAGRLESPRTVVEIAPDVGTPDGMAVDAEGGLWVALWGGGAVHRYTTGGVLDAVVAVPVSRPTSVAFGGPGLDVLYVTSSTLEPPPGGESGAGALFAVHPGVAGQPVAECAV